MENKIITTLIFCLMALNTLYAQKQQWDFPVKPGTEKWKSFQTTAELLNVVQVPEDILKSMSTEDLLTVCMNYPLLTDYIFANNPYQGFSGIISTFNGVKEFLNREDATKFLLKYYENKSVLEITKNELPTQKGIFCFNFHAMELLIAQDKIVNKMSEENKIKIIKLAINKLGDKTIYSEHFGFTGKMISAFIANKYALAVGKKECNDNDDDKTKLSKQIFAQQMLMSNLNVVDNVLNDVAVFMKSLK